MKTQELNSANTPNRKSSGVRHSTTGNIWNKYGKWFLLFVPAVILYSCNNSDQLVQQYKSLHVHDSLMMAQTRTDDSTIKGYISNLNEIQSNLDEIKAREKIITVQGQNENGSGKTAIKDIKSIDNLIIKSNREMAALHLKMKRMNVKDAELETMVARMSTQIAQQDTEIAVLQNSLTKVNNSYAEVTQQFNDSIAVLQNQNTRIEHLVNAMNTVYYAIGTEKELKDNKVIAKAGGFIGIGKNTKLTPDNNTAYFTKTDLTKLNVIPLNAKFKKLFTTHPAESYKIVGNKKVDSLLITDPSAFWSEDKYLVIAVK